MKPKLLSLNIIFPLIIVIVFLAACKKGSEPPPPNQAPGSFDISITDIKQTAVTLSWTAAIDPEGKQVTYAVVLGPDTVTKTTDRTIELKNLVENRKYDVTIAARDPEGLATTKSISFTTKEYDTPSAFEITVANVGGSIAAITWTASHLPDNSPIKYDVYLNDQLVKENLADTVLHYEFKSLKELTAYAVKVIAKSNVNKLKESTKSFTTVQDPAPTGLTVQDKLVSYSLAKFTIGKATDPEGQTIKYSVLLDNVDISSQLEADIKPDKDYVLRSLTPQKSYNLKVKATDDGNKSVTQEITIVTLKQPILVITDKSITQTADGFVYNLLTDVDYKPSKIILYANGTPINTQPAISSIIGGNTSSYTYPNTFLPGEGAFNIAANLYWGDDTEMSRTATFDSYTYYNFVSSSVTVSDAKIDTVTFGNKTYTIFFTGSTISPDPNYSIIEVVFGTINVPFTIFRTGSTTGYLTQFFSIAQHNAIRDGSRNGYVIMKDNQGYHKITFTFSYY